MFPLLLKLENLHVVQDLVFENLILRLTDGEATPIITQ